MKKVTKAFKACENGIDVVTYKPGIYEELPKVALQHGTSIKAVSDATKAEVEAYEKAKAAEAEAAKKDAE